MRHKTWHLGVVVAVAAAGLALPGRAADATGARRGPSVRIAARHLNNPRGVSVGFDGRTVYVAEAGRGGSDPGRCADQPNPETGEITTYCQGWSGAVTAVRGTSVRRVLQGLPSVADTTGTFASGPAFAADLGDGNLAVVMQGVGQELPPQWKPTDKIFGHGLENKTPLFDFNAYEAQNDPAGDGIDSDPYSVAFDFGRGVAALADAGGNDLIGIRLGAEDGAKVAGGGGLSTLAVFPDQMVPNPFGPGEVPQQSVPTSVALGPDGAFYVGELTGFPFTPGTARIWRVVPGEAPRVWKTGFTNITGLAFGRDGSLFVSEIAKSGLLGAFGGGDASGGLFRIRRNGTVSEIPVPGLMWAGGVAVTREGTIYQANCSVFTSEAQPPCDGQLLAIRV